MGEDLIQRLAALVGPSGVVEGDQTSYLTEPRARWQGSTPLILRPARREEVAEIMRLCAEAKAPIVPQGGNTGLVGGQIPNGPEILISLSRMTRIRDLDPANDSMILEAGVTLRAAQEAAEEIDRLFPLSLAAEGTATIGGAVSTNAGGINVLRYGSMRDLVLGLEVVLPDGRIWHGLNRLRKDNTGYDLKQLFIGAEGTLGIVTAAAVKLMPKPRDTETAFLGLASPQAAIRCLSLARAVSGGRVASFELIPRIGLDFVLRHVAQARDPFLSPHPWYVLAAFDSGDPPGPLRATLEAFLGEAVAQGLIEDAVIAANLRESGEFWRIREALPEVQKLEGGSIKHDISVPVSKIADFIERASSAALDLIPGCRIVAFGHVGDGNVHFNVSQPIGADRLAFLARWDEMAERVHLIAHEFGGSFSAEHGIGQLKRSEMERYKDPVALDLMRRLKAVLDPENLMNPGKLL